MPFLVTFLHWLPSASRIKSKSLHGLSLKPSSEMFKSELATSLTSFFLNFFFFYNSNMKMIIPISSEACSTMSQKIFLCLYAYVISACIS